MEFTSTSSADTKKFAAEFINKKKAPPPPAAGGGGATVVGLYGNLGSGKTTFVQCVAELLGVAEPVTSPTFVILKTYKLKTKNYKLLHHLDAYRLKSGDDLRKLGFEKLLRDKTSLILIEWADRVAGILPPGHIKVYFEFVDDKTRRLSFVSGVS
ncbi:MAG: tRNA (adenosine(37)-N6)-threonylcarbamoyltransferase complex ATPase subunit type 1 TsaE [Candidatus Taylorbacteria bacterium]|nr:tRNA (adenosine(37)-N6)-threonylcarbamoyltransferase complex ATPase subunit type 1 TsaE [Candidatus Taylorbacteria bacterium]